MNTIEECEISILECLSFDDAWSGILSNWFSERIKSPLLKLPTAIVLPSNSSILFIKENLLKNNIPILGTHFFTPGTLRQYLLNAFNYYEPIELRENLHLLMKVIARKLQSNPVAKAAEVQPEQFVKLADLIETTGWDSSILKNSDVKILIKQYLEEKDRFGLITFQKATDILYERSKTNSTFIFSNLLVFGFQSKHWSNFKILLSAVKFSQKAIICLITQDNSRLIDQAWLGSWEHIFGASNRLSSILKEKPFSYFPLYFQDAELNEIVSKKAHIPEIFIATDIFEEAELILTQVAQQLAAENVSRLGIVFPNETSPVAREVSRLLEASNILHHNHLGYHGESTVHQCLFEAWLNWQKNPRLELFFIFLDALVTEELLAPTELISFKEQALHALQTVLTDELKVIWQFIENANFNSLLNQWSLLPEEATLEEYIKYSKPVLEIIKWPKDSELLTQRSSQLLKKFSYSITKSDFLTWLKSITKPLGRVCKLLGKNPYSLVHLITEDEAVLQNWSHLILCQLNHNEWPSKKSSLFFLNDDSINELNKKSLIEGNQGEGHLTIKSGQSLMISSSDQSAIEKTNFSILLGAAEKLTLTAHLKNYKNSQDVAISEFLEKVFWITEGVLLDSETIKFIYEKTKNWLKLYHIETSTNNAPIEAVTQAYKKRRIFNEPFDEYSFCFSNSNPLAFNLSSKAWEDVVTNPEQAWFKHILGIKKDKISLGKPLYSLARGTWVHSWLSFNSQFSPKTISSYDWIMQIENQAKKIFNTVEQSFEKVNRALPDLWKINWYEAKRTAISLANELSKISEEFYLFSEHTILETDQNTNILDFPLKGRVDLIIYPDNNLNNKNYPLWIVDFKTGSNPFITQRKLEKGIGLQLALYALAFHAKGFENIDISILQSNSSLFKQLHIKDILNCTSLFEAINLIYRKGKLGMRNSMDGFSHDEFLFPLSTLKIEYDIIQKKWNLTHPLLSM